MICMLHAMETDTWLISPVMKSWLYHLHMIFFQCNKKRIVDYPSIWAYTRDILHIPGVKETVNQQHIQNHYMVRKNKGHFTYRAFSIQFPYINLFLPGKVRLPLTGDAFLEKPYLSKLICIHSGFYKVMKYT